MRIAQDLGLTEVPVEIIDVDEWEAEYLLIAENVERRGVAEQDSMKKARIAQFLKEYWGIKQGKRSDLRHNVGSAKVAEVIGESIKTTERLLKLNELIPQLQRLVSNGKLGTTSAEQLAYLSPEVQTALYDALGEEIGERTVAETKQLRQTVNTYINKKTIAVTCRRLFCRFLPIQCAYLLHLQFVGPRHISMIPATTY